MKNKENLKKTFDSKKNAFDEYDKLFESPSYKSNELLDDAYDARSKGNLQTAKRLAKNALEIYPDNIDALLFLAGTINDPFKRLKEVNVIVEKAEQLLIKEEFFDEDSIGAFWGIIETRPYMRARYEKMSLLYDLERHSETIKECEDMLRLNRSDNMGVRFILMALYVLLEKFEDAEKLLKLYGTNALDMKVGAAILYFKKGDYKTAKKYIKDIDDYNPNFADVIANEIEPYYVEYYSSGSIEEAFVALDDMHALIFSSPMFITFMFETLNIEVEN